MKPLNNKPKVTAADVRALKLVDPPDSTVTPSGTETSVIPAVGITEWQVPEPLEPNMGIERPYPLEAFPPIIREAIIEVQEDGKQPTSLISMSALATVSLVTQGHANFERKPNLISPLSLYLLSVADSGERKTGADKEFMRGPNDWQKERLDAIEPDVKARKAEWAAWKAEKERTLLDIRKTKSDRKDELEKYRGRLIDHEKKEPRPLIIPCLVREDISQEALAYYLATGWQSETLRSNEAAIVTGGRGMGSETKMPYFGMLNKLWDGQDYHQIRKQAESAIVEGRRLTVSLMVQPLIFNEFLSRDNGLVRALGLFARFLVAWPTSTMGTRFEEAKSFEELLSRGTPKLDLFHKRARVLLDRPFIVDDHDRLTPPTLKPSHEAFLMCRDYTNKVEAELGQYKEFVDVKDVAAKSADQAGRIAGSVHLFLGRTTDEAVAADMMLCGATIAEHHLREALRIMAPFEESLQLGDARALEKKLVKFNGEMSLHDIENGGPSQLRKNKVRRDDAILLLAEKNRVQVIQGGKAMKIVRNPRLTVTTPKAAELMTSLASAETPATVSQKSQSQTGEHEIQHDPATPPAAKEGMDPADAPVDGAGQSGDDEEDFEV